MSLPQKEEVSKLKPKCKWFGKRFGGYNNCIACEAENQCKELTEDEY